MNSHLAPSGNSQIHRSAIAIIAASLYLAVPLQAQAGLLWWIKPPTCPQQFDLASKSHSNIGTDPLAGVLTLMSFMGKDGFNEFFSQKFSPYELRTLVNALKNGKTKAPDEAKALIYSIYEFEKAHPQLLWGEYSGNQEGNAYDAILTKFPELRGGSTEGGLNDVIHRVDTGGLGDLELELVRGAARPNTRLRFSYGTLLRRVWTPLVRPIETIVTFNNQMRNHLSISQELRMLFETLSSQKLKLNLNPEELKTLDDSLRKVQEQSIASREIIEKAYKQDVTTGGTIATPDLDVYKIANRIESEGLLTQSASAPEESHELGELTIKRVQSALNPAFKRSQGRERIESDYFPIELKILHRQFARQSDRSQSSHYRELGADTRDSIYIEYEYEVVVAKQRLVSKTRTNAQGNTEHYTEMETYYETETRYGSGDYTPSYEAVLLDRLENLVYGASNPIGPGTISNSPNTGPILNASQRTAGIEKPLTHFRDGALSTINAWISLHQTLLLSEKAEKGAVQKKIKEIDSLIQETQSNFNKAKAHRSLDENKILSLWSRDTVANFKSRNEQLVESYSDLLSILKIYREQVSRQMPSLIQEAEIASYPQEFRRMNIVARLNYAAKALISLGIAGSTIYYTEPIWRTWFQ